MIIKATNCEIKVATAIPFTPNAGINKKPKMKMGFNIMLRKNDIIKTFLYVLVSPSACNDAWDLIMKYQLDSSFKPCNLVEIIPKLK